MKRKNKIFISLIMLVVLCFSSCYDYNDIEEEAIVAGIAFDPTDIGYNASVELITSPSTDSDTEIKPKIAEAQGQTLYEAIQNVLKMSSKRLDFGHCKVVFISEKMARTGIQPVLDLIFHNNDIRLSVDIVVVKSDYAADIFTAKPIMANIVSYQVNKTLASNTKFLSYAPRGYAYKCLNVLNSIGDELVLPVFEIEEVEDGTTFKLDGIALFKSDKLRGYLLCEESKKYMVVTDQINSGVIPFVFENEEATTSDGYVRLSPEIVKMNLKTKVTNDEELKIELNIKFELKLSETPNGINIDTEESRNKLEEYLAEAINNDLEEFIINVQKDYNSDIFGFGNIIYHKKPELWSEISENWDTKFKELIVRVNSSVKVKSSGISEKNIRNGI